MPIPTTIRVASASKKQHQDCANNNHFAKSKSCPSIGKAKSSHPKSITNRLVETMNVFRLGRQQQLDIQKRSDHELDEWILEGLDRFMEELDANADDYDEADADFDCLSEITFDDRMVVPRAALKEPPCDRQR